MANAETSGSGNVVTGEFSGGSDLPLRKPGIKDKRFISELDRLRNLRSFLLEQSDKLEAAETDAMSFNGLNSLRFDKKGRDPSEEEWFLLENHTQRLFGLLTNPSSRRKFLLGCIPWTIAWLPAIFGLVAAAALLLAILAPSTLRVGSLGTQVIGFYLVWLMSLGAIGALAFVGMNALSVQDDATFDLTNLRLMWLRVALGALFGLVLTLPFGFDGFMRFCASIANWTLSADATANAARSGDLTQALWLLLPFVFGFSTTLVIMILNQLVLAVHSFFGRKADGSAPVPRTDVPSRPIV